jgi:hypothetical protein
MAPLLPGTLEMLILPASGRRALGEEVSAFQEMNEAIARVLSAAIGVPFALVASSGLQALLYGVKPFAPEPFAIAVLVLVGAGIVATLLPSRNASRVDPLVGTPIGVTTRSSVIDGGLSSTDTRSRAAASAKVGGEG